MSRQSVAKWPVSNMSTVSSGDSVFTSAASRRGIDHDRLRGLEHALKPIEHVARQRGKRRTAMVDGGLRNGAQDPIGHVRRAWNLEKMTAGHVTFVHELKAITKKDEEHGQHESHERH